MVNQTTIIEYLNSIFPTFSMIFSILALIVSLFWNWYLRKWQFKTQYKIENINEIYPSLLSDVRKCKSDYESFIDRGSGSISNMDFLIAIFNDGRIEFINSTDKELYNNLVFVFKDILPALTELQNIVSKTFDEIGKSWGDYLENEIPYHTGFGHRRFALDLNTLSLSHYIKGNYEAIRHEYAGLLERVLQMSADFKEFPEDTPDKLIPMVKEKMPEVLKYIDRINEMFKTIIEGKIIPSMEAEIGNPV